MPTGLPTSLCFTFQHKMKPKHTERRKKRTQEIKSAAPCVLEHTTGWGIDRDRLHGSKYRCNHFLIRKTKRHHGPLPCSAENCVYMVTVAYTVMTSLLCEDEGKWHEGWGRKPSLSVVRQKWVEYHVRWMKRTPQSWNLWRIMSQERFSRMKEKERMLKHFWSSVLSNPQLF